MRWILSHKLVFIIMIMIVGVGVWFGLNSSAPAAPLITTSTTSSGSPTEENADQQLIGTLLALRAVTLSGTIFADPAFTSLVDHGTTIVPEPVGRDNPFAPLVSSAKTTAATSTPRGAQLFTPRKK